MNKYRNKEQCVTYTVTQNNVATIYIFIGMWSVLQNVLDLPEPNLLPNMSYLLIENSPFKYVCVHYFIKLFRSIADEGAVF